MNEELYIKIKECFDALSSLSREQYAQCLFESLGGGKLMGRPINPTKATLDREIAMLKMDIFPLIEMSIAEQELWLSNVKLRHALECVRSTWSEIVSEGLSDNIYELVNNVLETGECY